MAKFAILIFLTFACSGCASIVPLASGLMIALQGISQYQYTNRLHLEQENGSKHVSVEFECNPKTQKADKHTHHSKTRHVKGYTPHIYEDIHQYCAKNGRTVTILNETNITNKKRP